MTTDSPADYDFCEFGFDRWNPVQLGCVPFFTEDCNLVLSSSTATGKTAVAEAIFGYELSKGGKTAYASPLKAINDEKFLRWSRHPTFEEFPKCLLSSENRQDEKTLADSRMVISTVESLAVQCRRNALWLSGLSALVLDEAHLIGDSSRGGGCEEMLLSLTRINPSCRIILLSGTMANCKEMAAWIKSLNGKKTRFVHSEWRPAELEKSVVALKDFHKGISSEIAKACSSIQEKTLVFVHSRKFGERICRELNDKGFKCGFYHAGLTDSRKRRLVEDFRSEWSDIRILICTSSLGAGVDL